MKSKKVITIVCAVILGLCFIHTEKAQAQVNVQANLINRNLEVFFLSGLDVNSGRNQPVFFRIMINVGNQQPTTRSILLRLSMIKDGSIELYSGAETQPFDVSMNQPLDLTNRDLFSDGPFGLDEAGSITDAGEELVQNILSRGKLPTGRYTLQVEVRDLTPDAPPVPLTTIDMDISNPGKLDLIGPGRPAGRRDDCDEIFVTVPQFHWKADFNAFRVIIAEAKVGEDPESSLDQEPRFRKEFYVNSDNNFFSVSNDIRDNFFEGRTPEPLALTSFQYPSSGERLVFRPGKTYYWRVIAFASSTSGTIPLESEIFCFRIARLDQVGGGLEQYEFILRNFLGADYDDVFGEGGQLESYRPKRMVFKGEEVTLPDILQRLSKLSEKYSGYRIVN